MNELPDLHCILGSILFEEESSFFTEEYDEAIPKAETNKQNKSNQQKPNKKNKNQYSDIVYIFIYFCLCQI
jgi:hypothetical protein